MFRYDVFDTLSTDTAAMTRLTILGSTTLVAALLLAAAPALAQAPSAGMPDRPSGDNCDKKHQPKNGDCVLQSSKNRRLIVEISGVQVGDGAPEGSDKQIQSALADTSGKLLGCYAEALKRDPSAAGGLSVTFMVRPEGAHETIELQGNPLDNPAETCLRAGLLQAKLPEPESGEYQVTATFTFKKEAADATGEEETTDASEDES